MNRLVIRKIKAEEIKQISEKNTTSRLDEYLASLSKEEIVKIMEDQEAVMEIIQKLQTLLDTEYSTVYGGWYNEKLISYVALTEVETFAEIHIEVLPEYHGQGFGYEMLSQVVKMIFEECKYSYLRYTVIPSNVSSIALVKKLGGVLQEPESYVEKMLLKTYLIENT